MSDYIINAIVTGVWETFQMTFFASLFSYAVGMPLGIILYSTSRGRLLENRPVNFIIGLIVNITRSLPFLILLVLLIPFTRMIVGKSIGTEAAIVPLTIGAIPIVARMVEASLNEVQPGIIEAATSMGASPLYTILHFIIPEATPSLLHQCCHRARILGDGRCHRRRRTRRDCTAVRLLPLSEGSALDYGRTADSDGNADTGDRHTDVKEEP